VPSATPSRRLPPHAAREPGALPWPGRRWFARLGDDAADVRYCPGSKSEPADVHCHPGCATAATVLRSPPPVCLRVTPFSTTRCRRPRRNTLEHSSYTGAGCEPARAVSSVRRTRGPGRRPQRYGWLLLGPVVAGPGRPGALARAPAACVTLRSVVPRPAGGRVARLRSRPSSPCCSACNRPVPAVFKLSRRYGRAATLCSACYLELVGRSPVVPWRDRCSLRSTAGDRAWSGCGAVSPAAGSSASGSPLGSASRFCRPDPRVGLCARALAEGRTPVCPRPSGHRVGRLCCWWPGRDRGRRERCPARERGGPRPCRDRDAAAGLRGRRGAEDWTRCSR
jgi:hypothetical protein